MTIGKTKTIPNLLLILILFASCATEKNFDSNNKNIILTDLKNENKLITENFPIDNTGFIETQIDSIMMNMTLDEKIGQLFILSIRENLYGDPLLYADEKLRSIISRYNPGGIILFAINFANPVQTRDLIRNSQKMSKIPLFVAVDEEGGKVARLGNTGRMSVTLLPPAAKIGETGNPENAANAAKVISIELKALGFNMNMAPVADVNTNPLNPIIGNRTYSSDPVLAGKMVAAATKSMLSEKIIPVLKHFPGHGDTSRDTHMEGVVINHSKERLDSIEFVPFRMGIKAGANAIMTAHIKVPYVTGSNFPATMSSILLEDILREELGFEGIIITDAMNMGAVNKYWKSDEAAINAIKAGVDIILMPENVNLAVSGIKKALKNNSLSIKRIDESVRRILRVKFEQNLFSKKNQDNTDLYEILNSEEHKLIISSIFQK